VVWIGIGWAAATGGRISPMETRLRSHRNVNTF
jgi:hypothetical protein